MKRVAPSIRFLPALGALDVAGLACALPGQAPSIDEVNLEPTVRPPEAATTLAPAAQASTAPPSELQRASSAFRDDFEGTIDISWPWFQGSEPGYSLTHMPGWLRLNLSTGTFPGTTPPENRLLRSAPGADIDLIPYLHFNPHDNFEIAGLVVFDDDGFLQFGRGGCFLEPPAPAALGLGYALRLQRAGSTHTASYTDSSGGSGTPGTHTVDKMPVSVGLIAVQSTAAQPHADFDYFEVTSQ